MTITRRDFIRKMALNSAAVAATAMFPGVSFSDWKPNDLPANSIKWRKTPCRFCGTGCGLLVGVSGERAVAVKGDPSCSVNKGLCCVKGYHSIQVLYGKDRFKKAYIRKNGKMVAAPIKEALDLVAKKMQESIKKTGKDSLFVYMDQDSGQFQMVMLLQSFLRVALEPIMLKLTQGFAWQVQ